ncbi:MAG: Uma2 family endonuclease, partial [Cyanobacteria bacterium J06623_5]
ILSPSNTRKEMEQKLLFFNRHGVDEYYLYDTESKETSVFLRSEFGLDHIADMSGWVSPLLNIQFDTSGDELVLQRPDGEPFVSFEEATQKAEAATQKAEAATQKAEAAEQKAAKLAAKLKAMGIAPEQV